MEDLLRVAVIGGGFTGTTITYELAKRGIETHVFEAQDRLGGLASGEVLGDTMLDRYYRHIFVSDADILGMAEEVGMADEIEFRSGPTGVYRDGRIWNFSSPRDILSFKPLPFLDRLRLAFHAAKILKIDKPTKYLDIEDIPAVDYIRRTMGPRVLDVIWAPLLRSKFAEKYESVSAAWFWGKIRIRGQRSAKEGAGSEKLGYMKGGFQRLVDRMQEVFEQSCGAAHVNTPVRSIRRHGEGFLVEPQGAEPMRFDRIAHCAAIPLLPKMFPDLPADYRAHLSRFEYQAVVCLILILKQRLSPIYWLNVNDPDCPFVGVIEHTNFRSPEEYGGYHCAYLSRYLSPDNPLFAMSEDEVLDTFLPWLRKLYPGFERRWIAGTIFGKARYAQPVMPVGYSKILPDIRTPVPGLYLATMHQIYPEDRGMNYAIRLGHDCVARMLEDGLAPGGAETGQA